MFIMSFECGILGSTENMHVKVYSVKNIYVGKPDVINYHVRNDEGGRFIIRGAL